VTLPRVLVSVDPELFPTSVNPMKFFNFTQPRMLSGT